MAPRTTKTRHKADNTFRFETYADKLAHINTSIFSDFRGEYSSGALDVDTSEPYFLKCVQKWSDLDVSADFVELIQQIGTQVQTLAQIVHDAQRLIKVLYEHIQVEKKNSLSATFELITALEADLGLNFKADRYRFMKKIVNVVVLLKDAEIVEQAYKCLARMIKNEHLGAKTENFVKYLRMAKPLLDSKNISLQVLACQCFSQATGQRLLKDPVGTCSELLWLMEKHDVTTEGIATLLYCSIRGPQGAYSANGERILETIVNLCFRDEQNLVRADAWLEVVLIFVRKLFHRGVVASDPVKRLKLANLITEQYTKVLTPVHARHYFLLLDIAAQTSVQENTTKGAEVLGSTCPELVAAGLSKIFATADTNDWDHLETKACDILVLITATEPPSLPNSIVQAIIQFLRLEISSYESKRRILEILFAYPEPLATVVSACKDVLPSTLSPLVTYSDFMINMRQIWHQEVTKSGYKYQYRPRVDPYRQGELGTAVDAIKKLRRPYYSVHQLLDSSPTYTKESFWTLLEDDSDEEKFLRTCLCLNLEQYRSYISFFTESEVEKNLDTTRFLQAFLIMADGYHLSLQYGQPTQPSSLLVPVITKLIVALEVAATLNDGRELWILKIIDYLLGALAITQGAKIELEFTELISILQKYLRSGYVVLRLTAVSIYYQVATLTNNELLTSVCQKCLELELWNLVTPNQEDINKLMEDLIIVSGRGDIELNAFLLNVSLGLLFSKYEPIRKQCKVLIQSCCEANKELDTIVLNIMKQSEIHDIPPIPKSVVRIVSKLIPNHYSAFQKYETALFLIQPIGCATAYVQLNYAEHWALLWQTVATINDISTVSKEFKIRAVEVANTILRKYVQIPPHYGFKKTPENEPPNFLVSVITWIGRCWRFDSIRPLEEHASILIHFFMSGNTAFRKAGIDAMYNLDRRLEKYRDDIDTCVEGRIVDLTGFSKEAAVPIVNNNSDREAVMNLVTPLIAQRLWSSLSSKRKVSSKSLSPILLGLMGFHEEEVKAVIELVVGGYLNDKDGPEFKNLSAGNLYRRMKVIELMISTWKQSFPSLISHLLSMAIAFVRIVDAEEEEGEGESPAEISTDEPMVIDEPEDEEERTEGKKGIVKNRRQIIAAGFRIVLFIYDAVTESSTLDENLFQNVFEYIVAPRLEKLVESSTGGVSTALTFLKLWSKNPRYRLMLMRILPASGRTPVDCLVQVLQAASTSVVVKKFVLEIFMYLLDEPLEGEIHKQLSGNVFKELGNPALSVETNILLHLKPLFLTFEPFITYYKMMVGSGQRQNCANLLKLMQIILSHSSIEEVKLVGSPIIADRLLQNSMKSMKTKTEYLALLREIVNKLPDDENIIIYLAKNFRMQMSSSGKESIMGMLDGFSDVKCKEALFELSADDPNDLTAPDYARRAKGWQMLDDMFTGPEAVFRLPRLMLIGNFLLGILFHDKQAVQVQNSLRVFGGISKMITQLKPPAASVKMFINGILWPNLATIVRWKDNTLAFPNILLLLRIFILECSEYDHILKGLTPLCKEDEDQDILCGLTSIQVNNRTKAMNRLLKLLEQQITEESSQKPFPCFGVNLLRDYLVPLATYCIKSERVEKSGGANKAQSVLDNLVDCSIKVYRTAAQLFTPAQYLQFLSSVLSEPPEDPTYAKRFKRILLAIINGFKYTLIERESAESSTEAIQTESTSTEKLIQIPSEQIPGLTDSFRPLLERLNERLCNFTGKNSKTGRFDGLVDYSLMAECTLGVAKLLERFPSTLSEPLKDKLIPDICACMKSKEHKTRLLARNTLRTLMSVRTRFISFGRILKYLNANLKVGYQKHVLNHTVFTLLSSCKNRFESNPSEIHVQSLLPLCETEFFGVMDEEKGIGKITEKTAEARSPNARNILEICAQITAYPTDIIDMIDCALSQLKIKRSEKNVSQVKKWLDAVQTGVSNNKNIDLKEVLLCLQEKMKEYAPDSEELTNGKVVTPSRKVQVPSRVSVNSMDIDILPSKSIRDSLTTEKELLLHFQYKLLYNAFRSFKQQLHIAREYYVSAVNDLKNDSQEIMLLSHRLVTLFLSWDQTKSCVPESLLPDGNLFTKFWGLLVGNVVKYCETTASEETVNVIFTSLTTFLTVHTEMKLMKKDLTVLLSTLKSFLNNGHCVSSAMKFLTSIIEIKPEETFLEEIMDDVLKVGTRSTTSHVVEICHKVYLKYLMVYGSSRKGALNGFLNTIWTSAKDATFSHQAGNLLVLVSKILKNIPPSSFETFFSRLPILLLELLYSDASELRSHCLSIFDTFLDISTSIPIVTPIAISLMKKQPQKYDPIVVLYVTKVFNAVTRSSAPSEVFLQHFSKFMKNLVRNGEAFQTGLKVSFQQMQDIIEAYVKEHLWTANSIQKWKLRKLMKLLVTQGLEGESHVVRFSTLRIVSVVLKSILDGNGFRLVNRLNPDELYAGEELSAPFLETLEDLKKLMDSHFSVIEHSSHEELLTVQEVITNNLNILVQVMCHFGNKRISPDSKDSVFSTYFISKVKRLINREVTQKAEQYEIREICYTLLKTYVHLADADIVPFENIGLVGYEKLKGPYEYDEPNVTLLVNTKAILLLAVRDSTDANVKDEIRRTVDRLSNLLSSKLGPELFNPVESEVRQILHDRRRVNKAKKAEAAVIHPGLKRKRSVKPKGKDAKRKKKRA